MKFPYADDFRIEKSLLVLEIIAKSQFFKNGAFQVFVKLIILNLVGYNQNQNHDKLIYPRFLHFAKNSFLKKHDLSPKPPTSELPRVLDIQLIFTPILSPHSVLFFEPTSRRFSRLENFPANIFASRKIFFRLAFLLAGNFSIKSYIKYCFLQNPKQMYNFGRLEKIGACGAAKSSYNIK